MSLEHIAQIAGTMPATEEFITYETGMRPPRVDIAAILAARQATVAPASPAPTAQEAQEAQIAALLAQAQGQRERADQFALATQEKQQVLDETTRQVAAAQLARAERQRAIADYEQQAARAAQESLAAGQSAASDAERAADDQIARLHREMGRADAALATLQQQQAEAASAVQAAAHAANSARLEAQKTEAAVTGAQMHQRTAALLVELQQLATAGREHNRQVVKLLQGQAQLHGQPMQDMSARRSGGHLLYLPGALPEAQIGNNRETHQRGFELRYAADLVQADGDETLPARAVGW